MKKLFAVLSLAASAVMLISCGGSGSKSSKEASVTLGVLDDYLTVKFYKIESDAEERGLENLDKVKGTLTIVLKRNKEVIPIKPSEIEDADVMGEISCSSSYVFSGDCEAVVRKIVKMEPEAEETFTIGFRGIDPWDKENRQAVYDALTKKGSLDQIQFDIEIAEKETEAQKTLRMLKEMAEELEDE